MLEAGARGLPLVVSRTEGSDELVRDGENGFVVSRDPARLRGGTLAASAEDPSGALASASGHGPAAAPYAWSRVIEAYAEVAGCEAVLGAARPGLRSIAAMGRARGLPPAAAIGWVIVERPDRLPARVRRRVRRRHARGRRPAARRGRRS